ncbi:MAG: hypothetical protein AAGB48_12125, partial [Planctomycetota bacterium]
MDRKRRDKPASNMSPGGHNVPGRSASSATPQVGSGDESRANPVSPPRDGLVMGAVTVGPSPDPTCGVAEDADRPGTLCP